MARIWLAHPGWVRAVEKVRAAFFKHLLSFIQSVVVAVRKSGDVLGFPLLSRSYLEGAKGVTEGGRFRRKCNADLPNIESPCIKH